MWHAIGDNDDIGRRQLRSLSALNGFAAELLGPDALRGGSFPTGDESRGTAEDMNDVSVPFVYFGQTCSITATCMILYSPTSMRGMPSANAAFILLASM